MKKDLKAVIDRANNLETLSIGWAEETDFNYRFETLNESLVNSGESSELMTGSDVLKDKILIDDNDNKIDKNKIYCVNGLDEAVYVGDSLDNVVDYLRDGYISQLGSVELRDMTYDDIQYHDVWWTYILKDKSPVVIKTIKDFLSFYAFHKPKPEEIGYIWEKLDKWLL